MGLITVEEAAQLLGCEPTSVGRSLDRYPDVKKQRAPGRRRGRPRWLYEQTAVARIAADRKRAREICDRLAEITERRRSLAEQLRAITAERAKLCEERESLLALKAPDDARRLRRKKPPEPAAANDGFFMFDVAPLDHVPFE